MDFLLIANHPALDLVNTRPVVDGSPVELLGSDSDLARWFEAVGLPAWDAGGLPPGEAVVEARSIREALRGLLQRRWDGSPFEVALEVLNRHLARLGPPRVKAEAGGLKDEPAGDGTALGRALAPLLALVVRLLVDADPDKLRRCANPACVLWFLDVSKSGQRRWHSMETCGNAHKARVHRQKGAGQGEVGERAS